MCARVIDFDTKAEKVPEALLRFSGTAWDATYRNYCKSKGIPAHPARMQQGLPAFFIDFLTERNDLVLDPFAGSNTTGAVAEELGRRWVSVEAREDYVEGSTGRVRPLTNCSASTNSSRQGLRNATSSRGRN